MRLPRAIESLQRRSAWLDQRILTAPVDLSYDKAERAAIRYVVAVLAAADDLGLIPLLELTGYHDHDLSVTSLSRAARDLSETGQMYALQAAIRVALTNDEEAA